jgi:hypothetical protein
MADDSRRLPSSSSLAYCWNTPTAYFRSRCRTALLPIASRHSYALPRLPSFSSLACFSNAPMAYFRSSCSTALSHIAGLHHTHCHVCPHPPRWPASRTHRWPAFVRVAESRCCTSLAYIHTHCRVCPHHARWRAAECILPPAPPNSRRPKHRKPLSACIPCYAGEGGRASRASNPFVVAVNPEDYMLGGALGSSLLFLRW